MDNLGKILHQIKIRLVKEHHGEVKEVKKNDELSLVMSCEPKDSIFDANEDLKINVPSFVTDGVVDVKLSPRVMLSRIDESEINTQRQRTVEAAEIRKKIWPNEAEVGEVPSLDSDSEMYNGGLDDDVSSDVTTVHTPNVKISFREDRKFGGKQENKDSFKHWCEYCGKGFRKKNNMTRHVQSHLNLREFQCTECDKAFNTKPDLKEHQKIHASERIADSQDGEDEEGNTDPFKKHKCEYCGKGFRKKNNMTRHVKSHLNLREFQCTECGKAFNAKPDLKSHQKIHDSKRTHDCRFCGKLFSRKSNMDRHVKSHLNLREFQCTECSKAFNSKPDLVAHQKLHTAKREGDIDWLMGHICRYCGKTFIKKCNLTRHLKSHLNLREFQCAECGKAFNTKPDLKGHQKLHAAKRAENTPGGKPYECEICGKIFIKHYNWSRHTTCHLVARKFTCAICDKTFKSKPSFREHTTIHKAKIYTCKHCRKRYTKRYLMQHVRSYCVRNKTYTSNIKAHKCKKCEDFFPAPSILKRHVAEIHEALKLFTCEYCGYTCVRKCNLSRHIDAHRNARKHKCPLCDKAFNGKSEMKGHIKAVHLKIRDFTCEVCGKTFARKTNMVYHMKGHSRERMFRCRICGEGFTSTALRKEHIHQTHGKPTFPCPVCGKSFGRKDLMTRHARRLHGYVVKGFECDICHQPFTSRRLKGLHIQKEHWQTSH